MHCNTLENFFSSNKYNIVGYVYIYIYIYIFPKGLPGITPTHGICKQTS